MDTGGGIVGGVGRRCVWVEVWALLQRQRR